MNRLTHDLRGLFSTDIEADAARMLDDVRRGARRRKARRTAVGAVAAASVLVAGIAVGGAVLGGGGDQSTPDPAPIIPVDPPGAPPVGLRSIATAGDSLVALAHEPGCDCERLWRLDSDGWRELHRFSGATTELSFSPDGQDGFVADGARPGQPGSVLWATHDAGETWRPVARSDSGFVVVTSETTAWLLEPLKGIRGGPLKGDSFRPVDLDDDRFVPMFLQLMNGSLVVSGVRNPADDPSFVRVSRTDGTWTDVSLPCAPGELGGATANDFGLLAECTDPKENSTTVSLSTDLTEWSEITQLEGRPVLTQVAEDRYLATRWAGGTAQHSLLIRGVGESDVVVEGDPGSGPPRDVTRVGDRLYTAIPLERGDRHSALYYSDDDGLTWYRQG